MSRHIDIVFDGPPNNPAPRFVEVENVNGESIRLGEWLKRGDGYWVLRIPYPPTDAIAPSEDETL